MNTERKIAMALAEKMADDRAHRIATIAAEELIRTVGDSTCEPDKYLIPQCEADEHMRECISHLVWHGEVVSEETEDGCIIVLFIDATV